MYFLTESTLQRCAREFMWQGLAESLSIQIEHIETRNCWMTLKNALLRLLTVTGMYAPLKSLQARIIKFSPSYRRHLLTMTEFYSQFIKPGDLCFDIGANVGNRTKVFLTLQATVVAVEPQIECVQELEKTFQGRGDLIIVGKAVGEREGESSLMIGTARTISTMSREWIERTTASGRFSAFKWNKSTIVPVTTLDALIREYGQPAFCKIDVEGYESRVLNGLTQPIACLSFEFNCEFLENAIQCVQRCSGLGSSVFNYSAGESMQLALDRWVNEEQIKQILTSLDASLFGDVYARIDRP